MSDGLRRSIRNVASARAGCVAAVLAGLLWAAGAGAWPVAKLNAPLFPGDAVEYYRYSPDGQWAGYVASSGGEWFGQLYSVRLDEPGNARALSRGTGTGGGVTEYFDFTADSTRVIAPWVEGHGASMSLYHCRADGTESARRWPRG